MSKRRKPPRRKPHRTREEIAQILADYETSEMTQAAFVATRGIALSTFQFWRRKQRSHASASAPSIKAPSFIEVIAEPMDGDHEGFELQWPNGVQLRIPSRFHKPSLEALFDLIHSGASSCSR